MLVSCLLFVLFNVHKANICWLRLTYTKVDKVDGRTASNDFMVHDANFIISSRKCCSDWHWLWKYTGMNHGSCFPYLCSSIFFLSHSRGLVKWVHSLLVWLDLIFINHPIFKNFYEVMYKDKNLCPGLCHRYNLVHL